MPLSILLKPSLLWALSAKDNFPSTPCKSLRNCVILMMRHCLHLLPADTELPLFLKDISDSLLKNF
jgi:hypothetical protein